MTRNPAAVEAAIDRAVQRRLANDPAYRHAPDAETQAKRERAITREEGARVRRQYERDGTIND